MKSLFETETYQDILTRIDRLDETSERQWGKMTVGQMAWHCQIPLKLGIKNKMPRKKANPLIKWFYKKSLYNDRPWRKNLPTPTVARAKERKDFKSEKALLKEMITEFHLLKDRTEWNPHPLFGTFTPQQWGQLEYKHLDHHLRQFGV